MIEISFFAARKFLYFKRFELAKMIHSLLSKHFTLFITGGFDLQIKNRIDWLQSRNCCSGIKVNSWLETWIDIDNKMRFWEDEKTRNEVLL